MFSGQWKQIINSKLCRKKNEARILAVELGYEEFIIHPSKISSGKECEETRQSAS